MSAPAEATEVKLVNVIINGQEVQAHQGQTILEAARAAGVDIPTLCHDPRLEPYGACRICLVEVEGARGPMASCGTKVSEGMNVQTHSEKIVKLRKFILELLLTNHPLDCPVCEAAGDCRLQDYAYEYLVDMVPWGWRAPEASDPGAHPNVAHFGSRCILCGRCVRICRETMSIGCWGYLNRGYDSEVDTPYRRPLQEVGCVSCGQCVSTCPVGAIVGQRTPQGARVWQTTKTRTVCSYCANGCELVVHSFNGRVVRVTSALEHGLNLGNLCIKGRFGQGYAGSAERLLKPLVRDAGGELRESTWDEALAKVAEKAAEAKGGGMALMVGTHTTNEAAYLAKRLAGDVLGSVIVAASDQPLKAAAKGALEAAFGVAAATNTREDLDKAGAILVMGSNLTESNPVFALTVIHAIRKGKAVIVVDPRTTELARRATVHLAVKPGADLAVLRGMLAYVVEKGLQDSDFVTGKTSGYEVLASSVKNVSVDAEAAAAGIDPDELRQAAEAFALADAGAIIFGSGVTLAPNAVETVSALADLALLTGNVGRPGTGLYPLLSGANSQGLSDIGVDGSPVAALDGVEAGKISFLYVIGADPVLGLPDEARTRRALESAFVVVQDSFLSETAKLADVVFPAAVSTEDDGTFTNGERTIQRLKPAAPIKAESAPDWKILQNVANKLGAGWSYSTPADVMREIGAAVPGYAGASYARLENAGVACPCPAVDSPGTAILFTDGFEGRLTPVAGRVAGGGATSELPFTLLTGSVLEHHETGVRTRLVEGLTKLNPAATVAVNPADAGRLGLAEGALAKVSGATGGSIELAVEVTGRVPAGSVFIPGFDSAAPVARITGRDGAALAAVKVEAV